jgi:hypothetical protein
MTRDAYKMEKKNGRLQTHRQRGDLISIIIFIFGRGHGGRQNDKLADTETVR